jgi:hypothetical protein
VRRSLPLPKAANFAAQGISYMDMILQSGNVIGANNFAIAKIETVDSGTGSRPAVCLGSQ